MKRFHLTRQNRFLRLVASLGAISGITALLFGVLTQSPEPSFAFGASGAAPAQNYVDLAKQIVPSVVNISTLSFAKGPQFGGAGPDDLFRRFFEDFFRQGGRGGAFPPPQQDEESRSPRAMALGTGFIINKDGLILTNNHVVAGADEIKIYFTEETDELPTDGKVVGRDPELDLALIRVESKRTMVPVKLGNSSELQVGEYVIAVGNPFGQGHSVTHGIISAKERVAPDFILANYLQTDAPINPGNSGGPLVNMRGEVIGINNAIEARAQGIGFAIPIDLVKEVLPELQTKGTVSRGYIGVLIEPLSPEIAPELGLDKNHRAPFVTHVVPGGPADKAGVKAYDVISTFNGKKITSPAELVRAVTAADVSEKVPMEVIRNGKKKKLKIHVGKRPGAQSGERDQEPQEDSGKKKSRLDIGMDLENLTPEVAQELGMDEKTRGVVVTSTEYGGPADRAGILRGDVILEVKRKSVKTVDDFFSVVKEKGKTYLLRIRRVDPQGREAFRVIPLDLSDA